MKKKLADALLTALMTAVGTALGNAAIKRLDEWAFKKKEKDDVTKEHSRTQSSEESPTDSSRFASKSQTRSPYRPW